DRADAAIVRIVHVTHIEAGALTAQTAWAEGRDAALVAQLGERVGLVHELRELAGAIELTQRCHHRANVDERDRRELLLVTDGHALLDDALHAAHTYAQLVLDQLT